MSLVLSTNFPRRCVFSDDRVGRQIHDVKQLRVLKRATSLLLERQIPFLYASSAATYGGRDRDFIEEKAYEGALNVYGYSKQQFDNYVRRVWQDAEEHGEKLSQITGFRYFNVYGPREQHKGSMASVAFHLNRQINKGENAKLFAGSETFKRDFVYVGDVAKMNLWFLENGVSGIFNCGTGNAESFQAVADAIKHHGKGGVETVPFQST